MLRAGCGVLLTVSIVALVLNASCGDPEKAAEAGRIDQILQASVATDRLAGVVAMAVSNNEILYEGAFGQRNIGANEPMRKDTIFALYSMTKPITSVAVMQLVEQGSVNLDEAVSTYLPEFRDFKVLEGFGKDGEPKLRDALEEPTVRTLLSHTSGYAYSYWNEDMRRYEETVEMPAGRERFSALPLVFDPGSDWGYGPSADVLGILVESVSSLTLEEYFSKNIFGPLGIQDTSFQISSAEWSRISSSYQREPDGGLGPSTMPLPETPPQVTFFNGGGGLFSTAPDYIRFLQVLLNRGELDSVRILQPETVDLMAQNHIGNLEAGTMRSANLYLSSNVDFFSRSRDKFGFGFLIKARQVEGRRAAGSLSWGGLMNTYFWIDRDNNVCGVLMTQVLPFADETVLDLLHEYEEAVYSRFVGGS